MVSDRPTNGITGCWFTRVTKWLAVTQFSSQSLARAMTFEALDSFDGHEWMAGCLYDLIQSDCDNAVFSRLQILKVWALILWSIKYIYIAIIRGADKVSTVLWPNP